MSDGWIKLHRSITEHWLFTDYRPLTRQEAWIKILLTVNYEPYKTLINGQLYECQPGQSLLSLESWAKLFCWSVRQVRTFFKLLQSDDMIITEGLQYTTRLTVCKWAHYQEQMTSQRQANDKPTTSQRQADDKPMTTIKESKESKESKEVYGAKPKFTAPSVTEVELYCKQRKNAINPQHFVDYYETRGWVVGKQKMKDWKAAIRTWEQKEFSNEKKGTNGKQSENKPAGSSGFSRAGYDPNNGIGNGEKLSSKKRPVIFSAESLRSMSELQGDGNK